MEFSNSFEVLSDLSPADNQLETGSQPEQESRQAKLLQAIQLLQTYTVEEPNQQIVSFMHSQIAQLQTIQSFDQEKTSVQFLNQSLNQKISVPEATEATGPQATEVKTYAEVAKSQPVGSEKLITDDSIQSEKPAEININKILIQRQILDAQRDQTKKLYVSFANPKAYETLKTVTDWNLRDLLNDKLQMDQVSLKPVILSAKPSFSGHSLVLTTMPDFSADYLLNTKEKWLNLVAEFFNSEVRIQKNEKWMKFVIHGVPTAWCSDSDTTPIKTELEDFNSIH